MKGHRIKKLKNSKPFLWLAFSCLVISASIPGILNAMGGSIPAGLKCTFMLGVQNDPDPVNSPSDKAWLGTTPWDITYQYLSGGVNTGSAGNSPWVDDWGSATWALDYMNNAHAVGAIPVFTYYQLYQSTPGCCGNEITTEITNLHTAATMNKYFADFKKLMQQCATFGHPVIVHMEPDFWGNMAQYANTTYGSYNAANIPVSVAGSGNADVAGYANNLQGFTQALIHLRTTYGSVQTYLGYHDSAWINYDLHYTVLSAAQIDSEINNIHVPWYNSLATPNKFDLFFDDPSDRDADYKYHCGTATCEAASDPAHVWSIPGAAFSGTYVSYAGVTYIENALSTGLALRGMSWQVPVGNTYYKTCNNSSGHYRDNKVEAFLPPVASYTGPTDTASMVGKYAAAGMIGILWGSGVSGNYFAGGALIPPVKPTSWGTESPMGPMFAPAPRGFCHMGRLRPQGPTTTGVFI